MVAWIIAVRKSGPHASQIKSDSRCLRVSIQPSMEDYDHREVTLEGRAISHLLASLVLNERARIKNVSWLGQPTALDPCGIDNIDRESSQAWSPDIVPVGFDGMRNAHG
jgi:hypothetical protein